MPEIDRTIHQPVRLRIMAALMALKPEEQVDFVHLRGLVSATDGNLGAHLRRLEETGYVKVDKTFQARKPRTFVTVTTKGRAAFEQHVAALQSIVRGRVDPEG